MWKVVWPRVSQDAKAAHVQYLHAGDDNRNFTDSAGR